MSKKTNLLKKIRITYNAPVTLTFSILAFLILLIDSKFYTGIIGEIFTAPSAETFHTGEVIDYFRMILHIFGHSSWEHLLSNMAFVLLLGPVIEERYGSALLALMMCTTAAVTGVLNACFSSAMLLGCSDVAFMLILLTSFTSIKKCEIPLTFILILALYIGREIAASQDAQNISVLAHIAGGLCGSLFAFLAVPKSARKKKSEVIEVIEEKPKKASIFSRIKKSGEGDKTEKTSQEARLEEIDSQSPRFSGRYGKTVDSENTSSSSKTANGTGNSSNGNNEDSPETMLWGSIDL